MEGLPTSDSTTGRKQAQNDYTDTFMEGKKSEYN